MQSTTLTVLSGLALVATAQTTTTLIPDQPVSFLAQLYNSTTDCSGDADAICEYSHMG